MGGEGGDNIISGEGSDIIFGGAGADVFIFSEGDSHVGSVDIIGDFAKGEDLISLVGNIDSFYDLSFFKFNGNTAITSTAQDNDFVLYLKGDYDLEAQDFYFGAGNNGLLGVAVPIGITPTPTPIAIVNTAIITDPVLDDFII